MVSTKADPTSSSWSIRDEVVRLRIFGSNECFAITGPAVLGAADDCEIRLDDVSGRVSRHHASLAVRAGGYVISDLGSTNGIQQDGEHRDSFPLAPGVEIDLGGIKLIAESPRSIELHKLLARLVGWADSRLPDVDLALQAVRDAAHLRASLILRGSGSLVGVARRIHDVTLGHERPFVVLERGCEGMAALAHAANGTLFVDGEVLPTDVKQLVLELRLPDTRVRLTIGVNGSDALAEAAKLLPQMSTLVITGLNERRDELAQLLEAYARDAVDKLAAGGTGIRPHDLRWVIDCGIESHEQAEEVMLRLVAVRN